MLKKENLSTQEKKILQNRISAQKSRNRQLENKQKCMEEVDGLKAKYNELIDLLEKNICLDCK